MLRTRVEEDWKEVRNLGEGWNRLAELSDTHEVFSTFEYADVWMTSGVRDVKPHVVVVEKGSDIIAIAPLMIASKRICGIRLATVEFIGTPNSDYSDLLARDEAALCALWRGVQDTADGADMLYLQQIKESSASFRMLKTKPDLILRPCTLGLSARLPETPDAPVEAYIKGPGLRKRTLRRVEKEGAVELVIFNRPGDVRAHLPILFDQHIRRWAGTSTPSFFLHKGVRAAYANWAERLGSRVILSILMLNKCPVAAVYGFVHKRKFVVHTVAFDPDYKQFHCGLVCIVRVMQALRRSGIEYVDFTRGSEAFKLFFADTCSFSYECIQPRTVRAKCVMEAYLTVKDLAIAHEPVRRLAAALGYRAEGLNPEALKLRKGAGCQDESQPTREKTYA